MKWIKLASVCLLAAGVAVAEDRIEHVIPSVTNNLTLTWEWQPEFLFGISADANGSVTGTASGWYDEGTSISNNAVANQHYQFAGWTGAPAGMENANPLTFTLDEPYTNIVATFSLKSYTLTVVSDFPDWDLTNIGAPDPGTQAYPALSTATQTVDRIVVAPANPNRRLRHKAVKVENE